LRVRVPVIETGRGTFLKKSLYQGKHTIVGTFNVLRCGCIKDLKMTDQDMMNPTDLAQVLALPLWKMRLEAFSGPVDGGVAP
jgi:hypothetical protein